MHGGWGGFSLELVLGLGLGSNLGLRLMFGAMIRLALESSWLGDELDVTLCPNPKPNANSDSDPCPNLNRNSLSLTLTPTLT